VFAVGAKNAVAHVADPLSDGARLALCGGVALYLVGHLGFRLRLVGSLGAEKALAAVACLVTFVAAGKLPAWATAGIVATVLAALVATETVILRRGGAEVT
jgi:Bacterial low temperature requirement A protein (LtrA)